jgi:hypothetical protein
MNQRLKLQIANATVVIPVEFRKISMPKIHLIGNDIRPT